MDTKDLAAAYAKKKQINEEENAKLKSERDARLVNISGANNAVKKAFREIVLPYFDRVKKELPALNYKIAGTDAQDGAPMSICFQIDDGDVFYIQNSQGHVSVRRQKTRGEGANPPAMSTAADLTEANLYKLIKFAIDEA
jgi:hypothetical protein